MNYESVTEPFREIQHATAIINPVGASAERGLARLERFEAAAPFAVKRLLTSCEGDSVNRELIGEALASSDLAIIIGGDGLLNLTVNTMFTDGAPAELSQVPLLTLGGGGAMDGAKAKHSKGHLFLPHNILANGRLVESYPIEIDIKSPKDSTEETRYASLYAGFVATAVCAEKIHLPGLRPGAHEHMPAPVRRVLRSIAEKPLAALALLRTPQRVILDNNGEQHSQYELLFLNNSRMAKVLRPKTDVSRRELEVIDIREKKFRQVAAAAGRLAIGREQATYLTDDESYSFTTIVPLPAQFDGEYTVIPSDREVNVRISQQPIKFIVSRRF